MNIKEAKEIAYRKINECFKLADNPPMIIDNITIEFEWGFVFRYNSKKWIEQKLEYFAYFQAPPILVDKVDRSAHFVKQQGVIFDSELEKYREKKGYPQVVKFPLKINISKQTKVEQAKTLFRTGEIIQIKKGVKIIEDNDILDIAEFKKIIFNNAFPDWSFEEQIAAQFKHESVIINEKLGNKFPNDLKIFNDSKKLSLSGAKLESITSVILQLQKLERLEFWYSEINEITPELLNLESLKCIEILNSKLGTQAESIVNKLKNKRGFELIDYRK